jgi:hypothetical protein
MNMKGIMISNSTMPLNSTTTLNNRPTSEANVMSPKPSVLITVKVQ